MGSLAACSVLPEGFAARGKEEVDNGRDGGNGGHRNTGVAQEPVKDKGEEAKNREVQAEDRGDGAELVEKEQPSGFAGFR